MEQLAFLTPGEAAQIREQFGTPTYVYDEATLRARAKAALAFPNRHGLTVRYAMKALPSAAVLRIFHDEGLHIDASSGFEAIRAMRAGVPAGNIQLTAQELAADFAELVRLGVLFNACSLHQLEEYGQAFPGTALSVRFNPGLGSGGTNRTNVGGTGSSFGIWREHVDAALSIAERHGLRITGMHTHIGSGSDPAVWVRCARLSLDIAARLPDATRLSLGGGYKVARMAAEVATDLQIVGGAVLPEFDRFTAETGRALHLEIEPGTYLVANAGAILADVVDVVDTGAEGYLFAKLNTGMTEVLRPSLYGAQHPIVVVPADGAVRPEAPVLFVGHCCESGDILTPEPGNPEALAPRPVLQPRIGDLAVLEGAGAYCAAMPAKNYNSFPEAAEVLRTAPGVFRLIRRRQTLDQILENEIA